MSTPAERRPRLSDHPDHRALIELVGNRVRERRLSIGFGFHDFATHSGISARLLWRIENGVGDFYLGSLRHIAAALDIPLADLIDDRTI